MSYRTSVNGKQIFGNNEYYDKWGEYIKSKGIEVGEDGEYSGELDDFMEAVAVMEEIALDRKPEAFDFRRVQEKCRISDINHLFDIDFEYIEYGYMFLPYQFFKACESMLDEGEVDFESGRFRTFKLKPGMKIKIHAG